MATATGKQLTDSPSNLKEAIDWILRVTGKDSGGGQGEVAISKLSEQVRKLLEEVEKSASGTGAEITKVKKALDGGKLIINLADGLRQFIGYNGSGNGAPEITGAGIAPSNMATHRLCDAAIAFTIGVLEGCKKKVRGSHDTKLDGVITKLHAKYGTGTEGLKHVAESVKNYLTTGISNWGLVNSLLQEMGKAFDKHLKNSLGDINTVAKAVGDYLKGVFEGSGHGKTWGGKADTAASDLQALVKNFNVSNTYNTNDGSFTQNVKNVETALNVGNNNIVKPLLEAGKKEFLWQLQKGYKSYYQGAQVNTSGWNGDKADEAKTCAQIFLGCIPLIYHCLTPLYWLCLDTKKRWDKYPFSGGGLRNLMVALGYGDAFLGGSTGKTVMTNVATKLKELSSANNATSKPYPEFLTDLTTSFESAIKPSTSLTDQTIPALYHIARLYFRHQHGRHADKTRPPSSIREMLYWLSGLQFSPQYDSLQSHISSVFRNLLGQPPTTPDTQLSLPVADSGATEDSHNTLSAVDLKGYLTMTCLYSPMVLGMIQGPGASQSTSDPWLYTLFCNSAFQFKYPAGAILFNTLSNYTYALQFQLHFLYQQCSNTYTVGCGWRHCRFGKDINKGSNTEVPSHICPGYTCTEISKCKHDGTSSNQSTAECKHNEGAAGKNCGQSAGKASPLQAFLTDKLRGFSRGHPSDPSSHLAFCAGYLCHVPMGFKADDLRAASNGNTQGDNICLTLRPFCGGFNTSLRQLCEKLGCLTKRTPRTLGDLFGFLWHLNGQLFKNERPTLKAMIGKLDTAFGLGTTLSSDFQNNRHLVLTKIWNKIAEIKFKSLQQSKPTILSRSVEAMAPAIPFFYQLFMAKDEDSLPLVLFDLKQQCHKVESSGITHATNGSARHKHNCSSTPADLFSLQTSRCANGTNCGPYLYPLTHSDGATYNPAHASTYLSWVLYLSDDLQSWFQDMLDEFRNIDCKASGCSKPSAPACSHSVGQHGSSPSCQCASVVQCGGTLPLLYRHGF
ncbi:extracellular matrix-binding ebh [Babesia caballi]|uniref:Extracellular matrix-binding ebh n=1 Tax=Babesia caballi TaxID=5871 RepID=A0AAV4LYS3_BABCB|nr:extracellular matrix-binding ebh [Babesia caballi]